MLQLVSAARQQFHAKRRSGSVCPVCDRFGKEYSRPMRAGMALALIQIYKYFQDPAAEAWCHVESLLKAQAPYIRGGDWCKLRFWKFLVQPEDETPSDLDLGERSDETNPRSGYWRLTDEGEQFVLGTLRVQERVVLYNNTFQGLEGAMVDIATVLSKGGFLYSDVMA